MTNRQRIKLLEAEILDLSKQLAWESGKRIEVQIQLDDVKRSIKVLKIKMAHLMRTQNQEENANDKETS